MMISDAQGQDGRLEIQPKGITIYISTPPMKLIGGVLSPFKGSEVIGENLRIRSMIR